MKALLLVVTVLAIVVQLSDGGPVTGVDKSASRDRKKVNADYDDYGPWDDNSSSEENDHHDTVYDYDDGLEPGSNHQTHSLFLTNSEFKVDSGPRYSILNRNGTEATRIVNEAGIPTARIGNTTGSEVSKEKMPPKDKTFFVVLIIVGSGIGLMVAVCAIKQLIKHCASRQRIRAERRRRKKYAPGSAPWFLTTLPEEIHDPIMPSYELGVGMVVFNSNFSCEDEEDEL